MLFRPAAFCAALLFLCANLPAQEVALTFDDLPYTGPVPPGLNHPAILESIAKTLNEAHAPRVYGFINAGKGDSAALQAWTSAGFPLANHGYSHLNLAQTSVARYAADILRNEDTLSAQGNQTDWHWFRYPYLEEGETLQKKRAVQQFLKSHNYQVAEVTLDFQDFWWNAPYARCLARHDTAGLALLKSTYLTAAEDRINWGQALSQTLYHRDIKHIMLLHVGGFETVMLPELLRLLERKHFKLITLPEAASDPAYLNDPEWPTRQGGDFLKLMMHHKHLPMPPRRNIPVKLLNSVCR